MVPPPAPDLYYRSAALDLLRQPLPSRDILRPEIYRRTPLIRDIALLCDPNVDVSDATVLNLVVKYFHAYVHPGSHKHALDLGEITGLFELFARHRDEDAQADAELMARLRDWSFALRMLVDVPKTAHIFRSIASTPLPWDSEYRGLDIGTGSGILLLAEVVQAWRNGCKNIHAVGIEIDEKVGARTGQFFRDLGVGEVVLGNAKEREVYRIMPKTPTFVSNETVAAMHERLGREDFTLINQTLLSVYGSGIMRAGFFPEALIIYAPCRKVSAILSRKNGFQIPRAYRGLSFYPRAVVIDGHIVPLNRLGDELVQHIPLASRRLLSRRW
ncbi:hypothetical protein [Desulfocurvibacter africanus]|uniref:Methyltransferase domain-containing protein n=1 Tax=Desulfocurvibacter africanus subsp. africanus str. Walvis Bay TaxID=690850 RepID=F3YX53_DESAF|nr:hypothetical protein [Desulfocurvibacter africanus]EGJ49441.1 hypothetical protein Desaf_1098 [Desulfocurvibacter africanus subsp. africanus str. Walvis Bay]